MAPKAQSTRTSSRALRGAGGLRGVHARQTGRPTGGRASSGRGPTAPARPDRRGEPPRAIDRLQPLTLSGGDGPIAARLYGPAEGRHRPLIVAWGAGGTSATALRADDAWARDLADRTGAVLVLCGYRRAEAFEADTDAAMLYADLIARADRLGADAGRVAVTGRGHGFRVAARLHASTAAWPTLPTPHRCVAASPTSAAAADLRGALGLRAPSGPAQGVRVGTEVFTRDGLRLGRVDAVRPGDVIVRRGLTLDDLAVPQRLLRAGQGALTVDVRAAAVPTRDWGRAATDLRSVADGSHN